MILDKNKLSEISNYLQVHGILKSHELVSKTEKPGEGNMNFTLRLFVGDKTFIIKQARPYVEKYPSIEAPEERILVESEFYKIISANDFLANHAPKILFADPENHILLMEDLGMANDFTTIYKKENELKADDVEMCAVFLNELHNQAKMASRDDLMANRKLRVLNHEHIFVYPFLEDNGFDLDSITPGLQKLSMQYKTNADLKTKAKELGAVYLADGDTLLHGDYYPGSWLNTKNGLMVIDPEFAFYGKAEFDLGVLTAHLMMAQQPESILKTIGERYQKNKDFDGQLLDRFTGFEILRRIIGLAQLPLDLSLNEKEALLKTALSLIIR